MPRKRKCVLGCKESVKLYALPHEESRRKEWLRRLCIKDLPSTPKWLYVCEQHFSEDLKGSFKLYRDSIPDRNLPQKCNSSSASGLEVSTEAATTTSMEFTRSLPQIYILTALSASNDNINNAQRPQQQLISNIRLPVLPIGTSNESLPIVPKKGSKTSDSSQTLRAFVGKKTKSPDPLSFDEEMAEEIRVLKEKIAERDKTIDELKDKLKEANLKLCSYQEEHICKKVKVEIIVNE